MRIDFTLTLPGLFEVRRIQELADEFEVDILAKVVFGFTPDIVMSPLALPREILDKTIDRLITDLPSGPLQEVLAQLKNRPTFQEQWPDSWQQGLIKGKRRIKQLEEIRKDTFTMDDIVAENEEIFHWWKEI
jgi:hypothetical protein